MAAGRAWGERKTVYTFRYTEQLYRFSSDLNQLDEVRVWGKRENKVGMLYIS